MTKQPKKRTKPPFEPTKEEIGQVVTMTVAGITQQQMADCIRDGIDIKTFRKYFGKVVNVNRAKAHAKLGGSIYQRALAGDGQMSKLYASTQMGWKETSVQEHTGKDGAPLVLWGNQSTK